MSVEFEGDQHSRSILYAKLLQPSDTTPSIINWLTKTGIAKSPEGANHILIVVMVISFIMTGYTAYQAFSGPKETRTRAELKLVEESVKGPHGSVRLYNNE
jgi:hypothetical protein